MHKQVHKPLEWIGKNCVFPDSAGRELARQPVGPYLLPFQKKIIKQVLAPGGDLTGTNLFIYGARKISKSFLWSLISWYLINQDKHYGFRLQVMASVLPQAKLIWEQLHCQPHSKEQVRFHSEVIKQLETKSRIDFFANTAGSVLGQESNGVCIDEIGVFKNDSAILNLRSGGGLAKNFLTLFSSNPPLTDDHFSIDLIKNCDVDKTFKVHRFSLKSSEDWTVEQNWAKANPFLQEYFDSGGKRFGYTMNFYRNSFRSALTSKRSEHSFRRFLLGQFCGSEMSFIPLEKIGVCDETIYKDPSYRWCLGADYSITHDFTSLSLVGWSQQKNKIATKCFLYLPNTNQRRETQKEQFEQWEREGHIVIQKKDVLNGEQVANDVIQYMNKHQVCPEKICFDKALSQHHIERFAGFKKLEVKMTAEQMTPAIRELERVGCDFGLEIIGGNPCVKWQFGNVIVSQKSRGFCLMNRITPAQNIDAPVSISLGLKPMIENPQKLFKGFAV